eukprot:TRINITY_DN17686_c0_g1_i5.p4 TRINITY_DN17686_c0_g1~~TRINITY_DN17686_c0_g1_i5.p4  ORF type:complete len:181 (-),score=6.21 TRINITY_DN17686_c0_g1_i5:578-1120(-)
MRNCLITSYCINFITQEQQKLQNNNSSNPKILLQHNKKIKTENFIQQKCKNMTFISFSCKINNLPLDQKISIGNLTKFLCQHVAMQMEYVQKTSTHQEFFFEHNSQQSKKNFFNSLIRILITIVTTTIPGTIILKNIKKNYQNLSLLSQQEIYIIQKDKNGWWLCGGFYMQQEPNHIIQN